MDGELHPCDSPYGLSIFVRAPVAFRNLPAFLDHGTDVNCVEYLTQIPFPVSEHAVKFAHNYALPNLHKPISIKVFQHRYWFQAGGEWYLMLSNCQFDMYDEGGVVPSEEKHSPISWSEIKRIQFMSALFHADKMLVRDPTDPVPVDVGDYTPFFRVFKISNDLSIYALPHCKVLGKHSVRFFAATLEEMNSMILGVGKGFKLVPYEPGGLYEFPFASLSIDYIKHYTPGAKTTEALVDHVEQVFANEEKFKEPIPRDRSNESRFIKGRDPVLHNGTFVTVTLDESWRSLKKGDHYHNKINNLYCIIGFPGSVCIPSRYDHGEIFFYVPPIQLTTIFIYWHYNGSIYEKRFDVGVDVWMMFQLSLGMKDMKVEDFQTNKSVQLARLIQRFRSRGVNDQTIEDVFSGVFGRKTRMQPLYGILQLHRVPSSGYGSVCWTNDNKRQFIVNTSFCPTVMYDSRFLYLMPFCRVSDFTNWYVVKCDKTTYRHGADKVIEPIRIVNQSNVTINTWSRSDILIQTINNRGQLGLPIKPATAGINSLRGLYRPLAFPNYGQYLEKCERFSLRLLSDKLKAITFCCLRQGYVVTGDQAYAGYYFVVSSSTINEIYPGKILGMLVACWCPGGSDVVWVLCPVEPHKSYHVIELGPLVVRPIGSE